MYFQDLTPYEYHHRAPPKDNVLNVGWLSRDYAFNSGKVSEEFLRALRKLARSPMNLCCGVHLCEFCPPPRDPREGRIGGNGEIWVPGTDGVVYVAPALIDHYVEAHGYSPPAVFVAAVMAYLSAGHRAASEMRSGTGMRTLGVFAAIFDETGRILCVRTNYAAMTWTTPGGRVEPGESPLDALRREVLEETGLEVEPGELLGVYAKPLQDDLVLSFRASVVARNPWRPNDEIAWLGYFGRDELPEPMSPAARARVHDAFEGCSGIFRVIE
ncbi:MAG TPA: NUDIX domain-containing protein [Steroidobacteraceae bacterium]|nr:NUDIX domain-containing protein [Steroidobacteraceae bacterium]